MPQIDLDLNDIDPDELESGGFVNQPGWYLCRIENVSENRNKAEDIVFELEVLRDTKTGTAWKGGKIWFHLTDPTQVDSTDDRKSASRRLAAMAKRLGLVTDESLAADKAAGKIITIEFSSTIGREVWCEMTKRTVKGTEGVWPTYLALYPPGHPRLPKECGGGAGQTATPTANPYAASNASAPAAPAAVTNDQFADF